MLLYMAIAAFIAALAIVCFMYFFQYRRIRDGGIEADAIVSRVHAKEGEDADGHRTVDYIYYVRYKNTQGEIVEARLGRATRGIAEGTQLRVKYLPERPGFTLPAD